DRRVRADDRVPDLRAPNLRARLDRHVRPQLHVLQFHALRDPDGIVDPDLLATHRALRPAGLEEVPVRLEERAELTTVVPTIDLDGPDLRAVIDHVLERIGQVVLLALRLRPAHHVMDPLEEELPVTDVVEPDVRELRDRVAG